MLLGGWVRGERGRGRRVMIYWEACCPYFGGFYFVLFFYVVKRLRFEAAALS